MASRATRHLAPIFRSGFRSTQTAFRTSGRRGMATTTSQPKQSSDLPWIIGSGLIFVPTVAWILSSGKEKKHAHPAPKEPTPEPVAAEPTPEPVPDETLAEPSTAESAVSDDDGVVVSKEELEESINKAVDADVPKETKTVETTEAAPSEPTPAPTEPEPVTDSQVTAPSQEETTESVPPPVAENAEKES